MRILILGPSGTGKTTLCRKLSDKYNIPGLHLDSVYWQKDWERISKEGFHQVMNEYFLKHPSWVIDGNYTNNKHFEMRLKLADTIIYLDFGRNQSLKGIYERAHIFKHQVRSDMAEGCYEGVDQIFLKYVSHFDKFKGKYLKAQIRKQAMKKKVLIFKSRKELNTWLNSL